MLNALSPAANDHPESTHSEVLGENVALVEWLPPAALAFAAVVLIGADQGGYFPTSWGPATLAFSAVIALWLVLSGRSDLAWRDRSLILLLGLLTLWIGLSTVWSAAPAQSVLEFQRSLVVLVGASAVLVMAARGGESYIAFAVMAGITAIAGYSLATKLAPDRFGEVDPTAGYRLAGPIGYWNGLGAFAAMGIVLAVGIAVGTKSGAARIAASTSLVVLAPTLYFTFSRGAVIALLCGLAAMFAISSRRIPMLGALLFVAPAPLLAVAIASSLSGLTSERATRLDASTDARTLAWVMVGLGALAAVAAVLLMRAETRISISPRARRTIGWSLAALVGVVALAAVARAGGPIELPGRVLRAFDQPAKSSEPDLNSHLLDFSGAGRVDMWRVALSAYRENPVVGIGAGSFERYWQKDERATLKARDAHSLYIETLTELGPLGLALLLAAGSLFVSGALAARRNPIVPCAFGAFSVYAVHAGVEWDWELTGVTLTALFAGITILVALRRPSSSLLAGTRRLGLGVAVAGVALISLVGYIGNKSMAQAQEAFDRGNAANALSHTSVAHRWEPWSPYPLTLRGESLLVLGDVAGAKAAFGEAVRKDPGYWRGWLGLAVASSGEHRERALTRASELYRNSEEIYKTSLLLKR